MSTHDDNFNKQDPEFVMKILKEKLREMIQEAKTAQDSSKNEEP